MKQGSNAAPVEQSLPADLRVVRAYAEAGSSSVTSDLGLWAYTLLLYGMFYGTIWNRAVKARQIEVLADPTWIVVGLPTILLVVLLVSARAGIFVSPLSLPKHEATWLLSAPITRRQLLSSRIIRGLAFGAIGGLLVGLVGAFVMSPIVPGSIAVVFLACVGTGASLGVLSSALVVLVAADDRWGRAAISLTVPLGLAALASIVVGQRDPATAVAVAPWGWLAVPIAKAAGHDVGWWPVAVVFVILAPVALAVLAHRRGLNAPRELLDRQAGARSGLAASLYVGDVATVTDVGRLSSDRLRTIRQVRVRPPSSHALLVPWMDLVGLLRRRSTLAWVVGNAALLVWVLPSVWATQAAGAAAAVVALSVLRPLLGAARLTYRWPEMTEFFGIRPTTVVLRQSFMPILVLGIAGTFALVVAVLIGVMDVTAIIAGIVIVWWASAALVMIQIAGLGVLPDNLFDGMMAAGGNEFAALAEISKVSLVPSITASLVGVLVVAFPQAGFDPWDTATAIAVVSILVLTFAMPIANHRLRKRLEREPAVVEGEAVDDEAMDDEASAGE